MLAVSEVVFMLNVMTYMYKVMVKRITSLSLHVINFISCRSITIKCRSIDHFVYC